MQKNPDFAIFRHRIWASFDQTEILYISKEFSRLFLLLFYFFGAFGDAFLEATFLGATFLDFAEAATVFTFLAEGVAFLTVTL